MRGKAGAPIFSRVFSMSPTFATLLTQPGRCLPLSFRFRGFLPAVLAQGITRRLHTAGTITGMALLPNRFWVANRTHPFGGMGKFGGPGQTGTMILRLFVCLLCLALPTALRAANAPSGLLCDLLEQDRKSVV
jgi:hypothetical protein